jgi:hypothetical protein
MPDTTYNGWSNRETWAINLHFNPETKSDVDAIREYVEDEYYSLKPFMQDLINLQSIDWREIASHCEEEEEEDND